MAFRHIDTCSSLAISPHLTWAAPHVGLNVVKPNEPVANNILELLVINVGTYGVLTLATIAVPQVSIASIA